MTVTFNLETVPIEDRARVAGLIPDPKVAEGYVHRSIRGVEDFDLLDYAIQREKNVLLAGPTGSAKTTLFRAYAASRGLPFVIVESNAAMDPGVVIGRTTIEADVEGNAVAKFVDGDMTLVVRYGGVVLIDEINMAHPRITAAWHQLLSVARRMSVPENGEVIHAGYGGVEYDPVTGEALTEPQPFFATSAYNPGYQGGVRLNEALNNRFPVHIDWDYDHDVEAQLLDSRHLLEMAEMIRSLPEIRTPVSTNSLQEFEEHATELGIEVAEELFVYRFPPEERGAVRNALEANRDVIAAELEGVDADDDE
jgi:MoxR-like ATPase